MRALSIARFIMRGVEDIDSSFETQTPDPLETLCGPAKETWNSVSIRIPPPCDPPRHP